MPKCFESASASAGSTTLAASAPTAAASTSSGVPPRPAVDAYFPLLGPAGRGPRAMDAPTTRTEHDGFGAIEVPAKALWGARTARGLRWFAIGEQRMPLELIHAMAWVKWAAAGANLDLGRLDPAKARDIADAAQRVAAGEFDGEFPLSVWQTGSGAQSHSNVNEVVARLAAVDPDDDVNLGQSSHDVFPTAIHLATALRARFSLLPALQQLRRALEAKALQCAGIVGIVGMLRTHPLPAIAVSPGHALEGHAAQLALCEDQLRHALLGVHRLAIGASAPGAGPDRPEFGPRVAALLAMRLDLPLVQAGNLFAALAGHEALVALHGGLKMLAIALSVIARDIRVLGSNPRGAPGDPRMAENVPVVTSFARGQADPTQVEALTMVCAQVLGHDAAIGFAASQGHRELNGHQPLIALDMLDSLRLLADAMYSFGQHGVAALQIEPAGSGNEVRHVLAPCPVDRGPVVEPGVDALRSVAGPQR